jgi:molecular chaperone HscB
MNYFEFYNLPIRLTLDLNVLKKLFYKKSREYHPDFYTSSSAEKQTEVMYLATLNNKAYKILSDFDKRMEYVLQTLGIMGAEGETKMPQDFLIEMMEINETLADLQFDFDEEKYLQVKKEVQTIENQLFVEIQAILDNPDAKEFTEADKKKLKNFYLKRRYLLRIQKSLTNFASQFKDKEI